MYDMFGIHFNNHPELRRILIPADWDDYPLLKDYQHQEEYCDIKVKYDYNMGLHSTITESKVQCKFKEGNLELSEPNKFYADELRTEEMIIDLGPQHPSTHGGYGSKYYQMEKL